MLYIDYLWSLCHRIFKSTFDKTKSNLYRLMKSFADIFEKVRNDIYYTRHQYFIQKCNEDSLLKHGDDIHFPKFDSETFEQYRTRLLAAWEYFRKGGTIPGMKKAFQDMGYSDITIEEHFKTAGIKEWAIFSVVTPLETWQQGNYIVDDMEKTIYRLKPAHTLGYFRRRCFLTDCNDSLTDRDLLCQ